MVRLRQAYASDAEAVIAVAVLDDAPSAGIGRWCTIGTTPSRTLASPIAGK
jgi:hypothetical protein